MQNKKIIIDYSPQHYQNDVHTSDKRFKVLAIGRRGGKTECVLNELIRRLLSDPGLAFYISPTYRQSKEIAWVRIKTLLKPLYEYVKFNEQELYVEILATGSRIALKGADNEESLLGVGLKGVVFDETAMMKEIVWTRIVRPMLAESQGWAIFISTPKGRNWFYDLYRKGLEGSDTYDPNWQSWTYPTSINKYIPASEIEELKKDMSERLFQQEVMAQFLDDETGVFKKIGRCIADTLKRPVVGRDYTIGVDLAKTVDFTVITVIDNTTREVVYIERFQDVMWSAQKLRVQTIATLYNNALCYIDATGVGDPIVEDLQTSNVSVEPIKFNNTNKNMMVNQLAIAIEQRLIKIPNVDYLVEELRSFEYQLTEKGNITYSAPPGKHDDSVISLSLAVWGIRSMLKEVQSMVRDIVEIDVDRQGYGEKLTHYLDDDDDNDYEGY